MVRPVHGAAVVLVLRQCAPQVPQDIFDAFGKLLGGHAYVGHDKASATVITLMLKLTVALALSTGQGLAVQQLLPLLARGLQGTANGCVLHLSKELTGRHEHASKPLVNILVQPYAVKKHLSSSRRALDVLKGIRNEPVPAPSEVCHAAVVRTLACRASKTR